MEKKGAMILCPLFVSMRIAAHIFEQPSWMAIWSNACGRAAFFELHVMRLTLPPIGPLLAALSGAFTTSRRWGGDLIDVYGLWLRTKRTRI